MDNKELQKRAEAYIYQNRIENNTYDSEKAFRNGASSICDYEISTETVKIILNK